MLIRLVRFNCTGKAAKVSRGDGADATGKRSRGPGGAGEGWIRVLLYEAAGPEETHDDHTTTEGRRPGGAASRGAGPVLHRRAAAAPGRALLRPDARPRQRPPAPRAQPG